MDVRISIILVKECSRTKTGFGSDSLPNELRTAAPSAVWVPSSGIQQLGRLPLSLAKEFQQCITLF